MDRWQDRIAVVTGASAGIGAAIVKDLVKAGVIVVGLARRKERIDEIRDELPDYLRNRLHAVRCDVSDLKSVNDAFDWIEEYVGGIDILINNAAVLPLGQILTLDISKLEQAMQVNVIGVISCTQRAYQSMKKRNFDGHIIMINSIAGHKVVCSNTDELPVLNIYPSTKHAMTAMTEVIRQELNNFGTNIKITSISPGVVNTDILPQEYKPPNILRPEDVSAAVMYAISTPPSVQIYELMIKAVGEVF